MDASDIIRLLHTSHYAPADLEEVNKICKTFPEFSAAQLLRIRIMEALGREKQQELKVAAVYAIDRQKLYQLVTGAKPAREPEPAEEETEVIHFSDEASEQAEVIIEHHAPYAGTEPDTDLLELDEDAADQEPAEAETAESEPAEGEPAESEPAEGEPEESESAEAETAESESAEGEPAEREPAEEETAEREPAEGEPAAEEVTDEESGEEEREDLLSSLEKNETDMEEPKTDEDGVPAIDQVEQIRENRNNHLISNFIREKPGPIRPDKETRLKGDVSLESIREHDGFITDTLARIYVKQGLFAKAIYAYEKLSLKYPEKSAYFAAQIEKIRNINHS